MSEKQQPRFLRLFSDVPDPRRGEHLIKHQLFDLIFIAIAGCVSGVDDWQTIVLWAQTQKGWLQKYCTLENGIPSWWTFRRVFRILDPEALQKAFVQWMRCIQKTTGSVVAIDGKTIRRSLDSKDGKGAIHVVSAWLSANRVVLGQRKVDDKSNEITAIPELLALLEIEGLVVTIDAMGCQKDIVSAIVEKKADYVLAVKDNQPNLHADIQSAFSLLIDAADAEPGYFTQERGHGREETRQYFLSTDLSGIRGRENWPSLKSIGMVVSERKVGDKESIEVRYYISSLSDDAERFGKAVRDHWGVENGLHWVLDIAFDEDRNRTRKGDGAENLSTIRRIALNLLRDCKMKCGVKGKRILANADCGIREKILKI